MSKHITNDKIPLLAINGFKITVKQIKNAVNNPDHIDTISDAPKIIASIDLDTKHILRVVYKIEIESDIIRAITVYPAEKGRYY